jgi:lipoprotein-anchoring transpeptidase ErfK/SrfK
MTVVRDFGKVASRRASLLAAVLVLCAAAPGAQAAKFFDPERRQWVEYDTDRARGAAQAPAVDPRYERQLVEFRTAELPGTIIIDSDAKFLYLVQPGLQAIRYGVGVGRDGFGWSGIVEVGRKAEWPTWTPPAEMVARDPKAAQYASGMPGGPDNPLGARALYLYKDGHDTIYRIHGTNEPWTIGMNISSGCIRMRNGDVEDLYARVPVGSKVIVIMQGPALITS